MGYLDDNGLAKLWEKIKSRLQSTKNVIAPAPIIPINIVEEDTVYLNHVVNSEVVSSHLITGSGGTKVVSHSSGTNAFDGVIEITSAGANVGVYTPEGTVSSYEIDTGFSQAPKIFKLYYNHESEGLMNVADCYPQLESPYTLILHNNLPVSDISFNHGIATVKFCVTMAVPIMWEAYI